MLDSRGRVLEVHRSAEDRARKSAATTLRRDEIEGALQLLRLLRAGHDIGIVLRSPSLHSLERKLLVAQRGIIERTGEP